MRKKGFMFFVGREKETKTIIRALEDGRNVILRGLFGIGRTALARHVAEVVGGRWTFHFVDFSRTPREMCGALALELQKHSKSKKRWEPMRYKSERYRVLHGNLADNKNHVIVFDNVAKLTHAKISMLRLFAEERRFQTITIIEHFIKESDEVLLRSMMMPSDIVSVGYLNRIETRLLVRMMAKKRRLKWDEQRIGMLAGSVRGYPLGIVDHVTGRTTNMARKNANGLEGE
ncbi:MAG: AAA family ATPase [bacterium]